MYLNDEPQCITDPTSQKAQNTEKRLSTSARVCVRTVLEIQKIYVECPQVDFLSFNESKYHCSTNSS